MELKGSVAVVTGGASGIGRALCQRFAAEGARGIVVSDMNEKGAQAVAVRNTKGFLTTPASLMTPAEKEALRGVR